MIARADYSGSKPLTLARTLGNAAITDSAIVKTAPTNPSPPNTHAIPGMLVSLLSQYPDVARAVGLDVTTDPANQLSKEMFEEIEGLGTRRNRQVADLCRGLVRRFGGFSLHDPLVVATVADPNLAKTERFKVDFFTAVYTYHSSILTSSRMIS